MNWAHFHLVVNDVPILGSVFASILLLFALTRRERESWVHPAMVILAITFGGTVAAFFSGDPAIEVIEGMPRTSARALSAHHVRALVGVAFVTATLLATMITLVSRRRRGSYSTVSLAVLLATTVGAAGTLTWTGNAGGRINHPELQESSDLDSGPAHPH